MLFGRGLDGVPVGARDVGARVGVRVGVLVGAIVGLRLRLTQHQAMSEEKLVQIESKDSRGMPCGRVAWNWRGRSMRGDKSRLPGWCWCRDTAFE